MPAKRVLGAVGTLVLLAGCSGEVSNPGGSAKPPEPEPSAQAPSPPARVPELPLNSERDVDGDRLDDVWQERLRAAHGDSALLAEPVRLQVILTAPLEQAELDDFTSDGGQVEYVFRELSYGFVGTIALGKLPGLARHWGDKLHLLAAPSVVVPFLDEATRTGRVRGVWAGGFAASASGYSGDANITIAVLDTGVYEQHPDLTGRKQGWEDYTLDNAGSPRDIEGHGTHVASIALGSGAAFGASAGTLKYTQSGSLSGFPGDTFVAAPIHTPAYLGSGAGLEVSAQARFLGGGSARLYTMAGSVRGLGRMPQRRHVRARHGRVLESEQAERRDVRRRQRLHANRQLPGRRLHGLEPSLPAHGRGGVRIGCRVCQSGTCVEPGGAGGSGVAAVAGAGGSVPVAGTDAGVAGAADPNPNAAVGPSPSTSSGCGCSVPGAARASWGGALVLLAIGLGLSRGRARSRTGVLSSGHAHAPPRYS